MHIPRVYLDVTLAAGHEVTLDDQVHHHLVQVLRLKTGARFVLFNGRGGEYWATLNHIACKASSATVDAFMSVDREPSFNIELWQGIATGARMDYALQKAVELGVSRIRPVLTRYTAAKQSNWHRKMAHWQGVIISACEQSGRTRIVELEHPRPLPEYAGLDDATLGLVLDPQADCGLRDVVNPPRHMTLLIGPEGGLRPEELRNAQDKGFKRARMGPRILRTETAAVVALAAVQLLWGDLN
jgi:16S rRNA (uracil1498-N3)-methyltransferase